MPELPEVETIRTDLEMHLLGRTIEQVRVLDDRVIKDIKARDFCRKLKGQCIGGVHRRGKALIFSFSGNREKLIVQLMMTGQLIVGRDLVTEKATKVIFTLCNKFNLFYNDVRLFGALRLIEDLEELKYFRILGPEPLSSEWTAARLMTRIAKSRRPIKSALMDHTVVAGIGNIYASEILFDSGILPQRPAEALTAPDFKRLCRSTKKILKAAIKNRGTSMNNYRDSSGEKGRYMQKIRVYHRTGEPCRHCQQRIEKIRIAGRSSFYCPHCQD